MTAFLTNHSSGYSLTCGQFLTSAFFPPLSASIFAGRHNDCADALNVEGESACCHRFVAFLEYIPVVGMIAGIVERIIAFVYTLLFAKTEEVEQPPADLSNRIVQSVETSQPIIPVTPMTPQSHPITSTPDLSIHLPSRTDPRPVQLQEEIDSGNAPAGSPEPLRNTTLMEISEEVEEEELQEPDSSLDSSLIPLSQTRVDEDLGQGTIVPPSSLESRELENEGAANHTNPSTLAQAVTTEAISEVETTSPIKKVSKLVSNRESLKAKGQSQQKINNAATQSGDKSLTTESL